MRRSRIHTDQHLEVGTSLELPSRQSHYIATVLRLTPDVVITLFNGNGLDYTARISASSRKRVQVEIEEETCPHTESGLSTHLGVGISRGERMDYIIQKSVELGVTSITPLFSERCEVRLNDERAHKRRDHWQQIAVSACEQCGRSRVPEVKLPIRLMAWLETEAPAVKLVFDYRSSQQLGERPKDAVVSLLTGPEGGFTEAELEQAMAAGFSGIQLGNRILRAETAPLAALSILQFAWGDFSPE